jgi:hypothetical protein
MVFCNSYVKKAAEEKRPMTEEDMSGAGRASFATSCFFAIV